jgi:hypothetical protein
MLLLLEVLPPPSPTKLVRRRPEAVEGAEAAAEAAEAAEAVEAAEVAGAGLAPAEAAAAADTPTKCKPFRETLREVLPSNA